MTTDISTLANWIHTSASTVFFGGDTHLQLN